MSLRKSFHFSEPKLIHVQFNDTVTGDGSVCEGCLCKHGDPSLPPEPRAGEMGVLGCACSAGVGEAGTGRALGLAGQQF